jgi:hypothetical protein
MSLRSPPHASTLTHDKQLQSCPITKEPCWEVHLGYCYSSLGRSQKSSELQCDSPSSGSCDYSHTVGWDPGYKVHIRVFPVQSSIKCYSLLYIIVHNEYTWQSSHLTILTAKPVWHWSCSHHIWQFNSRNGPLKEKICTLYIYSRLSIIRAWFNRFAAQPRQCIFKEKILFSVSITFVVLYASQC